MTSPRFFAAVAGPSASAAAVLLLSSALVAQAGQTPAKPAKRTQTPPQRQLPRPVVGPDTSTRPHAPILPPNTFMPVSQLKNGMKGYGLSVFQGNKIERFDVTILGVMRKVNNGRDLILVKLGGPQMRRVTDVIAGMSGSPVYVNGKIVGAVSYGSQFTRESIGYLTPIEDMLDAWDPALPQSPDSPNTPTPAPAQSVSSRLPQPLTLDGKTFTRIALTRSFLDRPLSTPGTLVLRPLAAKVTVSGVSGSRWESVKSTLAKMGMDARQGPGSVGSVRNSGLVGSTLTPGGAIAMSLATGDIDITGIGTLTYRRGSQVVAFGHPFLNIGPLDAPMYTAYIHDIEPSFSESSKIGSPVKLVGAFSQDRPFSIGGRIGAKPALVPVTVRVQDKAFGRDRVFRAQLVRHPNLTPQLIPLAASTAVAEVHGQPGDAMATVTTTVVADEVGTITRTNRVYDGVSIDSAATGDLMSLMSLLSANPFYPVAVRSATISVAIEPGRKTAQVERIYLNQSRYEPGETVEVGVVLKPYKQPRVTKMLHVTIPASTPNGILPLTISGGGSGSGGGGGLLGLLLGGRGASPEYATATTVKQLIQKYKERDRNDALVARLQLPTSAISISGEKMPGLPANLEAVLKGNGGATSGLNSSLPRSSGVRLERDEVKVSEPTDYVLSGSQVLPIRVARKNTPAPSAFGSPFGLSGVPGSITIPTSGAPTGTNPPPSGGSGGTTITILPPSDDPSDDEPLAVLPSALPLASGLPLAEAVQPPAGGGNSQSIYKMLSDMQSTNGTGRTVAAPPSSGVRPATSASETVKPVNRQPGVWRQTSAQDFRTALKLDGVTVTGAGDVRLAPRLAKVADTTEPYFWCLVPDGSGGGVFAGSGDNGTVYHVQNGKAAPFATTGELEVFSLVRAKNGDLYAGTAPNGRIFRITEGGKATRIWASESEKYVLSLALSDDEKTLYAGLGGPSARIVALPVGETAPTAQTLYQSDEGNVTTLAVSPSGELYAGTSPNGLVVHVAGKGVSRPTVVYDAAETAISGLALDEKTGDVFATTSVPRSALYRVTPGGGTRVLYDKLPPGSALSGLRKVGDTLYTGSGATVYAIGTNGDSVQTFDAPSDIQILNVATDNNNNVWASTGSTGGVYALQNGGASDQSSKGELVSSILDAKSTAKWGTLRWTATVPQGAKVELQTRSGDTFDPDKTWSNWSRIVTQSAGESITSPPARYLQYRAVLTSGGANATSPQIKTVEAFYLTPNQAPQITLTAPRGGEVLRGQSTIRWAATDPDRDTLLFEVALSGDGGKTWTPVRPTSASSGRLASLTLRAPAGARPTAQGTARAVVAAAPPSAAQTASDLAAELARHPEISPDLRARILADAPPTTVVSGSTTAAPGTPTRSEASAAAQASNGPLTTRETTVPLDTSRFADGTYLVRVKATDTPSNPDGALTDEKISGEIRIVNRPPLLVVFGRQADVRADKSVKLEGVASHPLAGIRAVQYRVDNGEWMAARANDGIFDGTTEPFTLTTAPLSPGNYLIEVQAQDEAGNTTTQKTTVTIR